MMRADEIDEEEALEGEATGARGVQTTVKLELLADGALRQAADGLGRDPSVGDRVVHDSLRAKLFGRAPEPTRIGRFVIVRRIGAGGMGVVYSAYDEELDRKVAIKLLHAERSGSQGRARILREAQALARISHPNIVHVYEVGEYEGQVFMAMEFVEGMTIDEWAHRKTRSWREVLAAYRQAAEGLAAAHEAGLVHRDIKPENMLITERGQVILLDFGLARLSGDESERPTHDQDGEGVSATVTGGAIESIVAAKEMTEAIARTIAQSLTAAGAIMGTPAYMSPEQCSGLPADTRSDQFSFCVSLYEGLYGERPFAGESLSSLILAVCQGQVREAPRGSSVPTWLRRVLLRGLSVKPSERWPSMQALAEALSADPIKRRRTWLGAAAVAASLATGVLGAWQPWVGGVCGGAGERLGQVWGSAQKTAVRSALLATGFGYAEESWSLVERRLDEYAASWASIYTAACEAHHRGETSGDLYDRQMACLESRLGEVRMMVDVLAAADATVLQQTSEILVGLPPLSTCGDTDSLSKSYAPPPDQKTAEAVEALRQRISSIHMRAESGHAIEVIDEAEGVVRAARTLGYRPLLAEALFTLGRVYLSLYQSPQAEEALLDAFLTADAVRHDGIAATAGAWLVFLNARNGRDTEARLRAEHVKAVIERYGQTTTADVNLHRGLATLEFVAGRYDEARRGFKHALAIAESLPEGQGERLATLIHVNIGQVCEVQGDVACMSSNFERAMERMSERVGAGDPKLGMYRYMLAKARVTQGRGDEAQALIQESLADIHRAFGERHNMYVTALMWSGEVNFYQGRVAEALAQSQEALTLGREVYGENHAEVLGLTLSVAEYLRTGGRLEEARARVEEADAIKGRLGESAGFMAAKVDHIRGQVLADAGDLEGARSALEAFLAAREKYGPSLGPDRATAAARLAQVKIELGDRVAGAALLAEARRSIESISEDHWALVEILKISGEVALAEGRRADAATDAERALRILDRYGCFRHDRTAVAFLAARALIDDDRARALRLAEEALANEAAVSGVAGSRGEAIRAWLAAQGG